MFALKTDKPQRRHTHCILWPMVFVFLKSKADKILKFQGLYPAKTTTKKSTLLWYGRRRLGDTSWETWLCSDSLTSHFLFIFFSVRPKDQARTPTGPCSCATCGQPQGRSGLASVLCRVRANDLIPRWASMKKKCSAEAIQKGNEEHANRVSAGCLALAPTASPGWGTGRTKDLILLAPVSSYPHVLHQAAARVVSGPSIGSLRGKTQMEMASLS